MNMFQIKIKSSCAITGLLQLKFATALPTNPTPLYSSSASVHEVIVGDSCIPCH